jgi:hypothetical protein
MGFCELLHERENDIKSRNILTGKITLCRILGSHSGGYEEFCLQGYNGA